MKYLSLLFCALLFSATSLAEQFPSMTLTNQWDKAVEINDRTTLVFFAADMDGSDIIKESLDALKITNLSQRNWVYVANISGMPSIIANMFALPKMRDYAFPIALDSDGEATINWIRKENQVTVFTLRQLTIEQVQYFADKEAFTQFLSQQVKEMPTTIMNESATIKMTE